MTRRTISRILGAGFAQAAVMGKPGLPMDRVAMTTTTFHAWFEQTREKDQPSTRTLTLLGVPEYYADRFKCHNLEFWSKHFESQAPSYLAELKRKTQAAKSQLINIQVDGSYELANPEESVRRKGIDFVKSWIDTAADVGAPSVRANTGNGAPDRCIMSYRELKEYAKKKRVLLLTENHGGISMKPETLLLILKEVGCDNFEVTPDFGNLPSKTRYTDLKNLLPYAKHIISAKATEIGEDGTHAEFDFDRCMKIAQEAGFPGYYSAEYWAPKSKRTDYENVADWMLRHIRAGLAGA